MKIIFVIQGLQSGGAERVVSVLSNEFAKRGHQVMIMLTENGEDSAYSLDKAIKIIDLSMNRGTNIISRRMKSIQKMRKMFKKEAPDIIISFITRTNICTIIAGIGLNIPIFVSERNNPQVDPKSKITRLVRNIVYPLAKGIVFQTHFAKSCFSKKIQNKSVVIYNPISSDLYNVDLNAHRKKRIVSICRLNSQKNLPLLINAFASVSDKYPEYILEIYGEGELRKELQGLGISEKCFLRGSTKNSLEILSTSEIFALASDYEGMSNALIEAMCCGCSCISTDSPAYAARELIHNNENGILVRVGDMEEFSEALDSFMSNSQIRNHCGINARQIEKKVNTKRIIDQWINFIQA